MRNIIVGVILFLIAFSTGFYINWQVLKLVNAPDYFYWLYIIAVTSSSLAGFMKVNE